MAHIKHIVNVEGAIVRDDAYLVVKRSLAEDHVGGLLSFVGGTIEPEDNSAPDVLRAILGREIREEVNVEIGTMTYATSSTFQIGDAEVMNIVFLCEYESGTAQAIDPDEVESVQWMTASAILKHPDVPQWIRDYTIACEAVRTMDT